jgi:hypothetical protein
MKQLSGDYEKWGESRGRIERGKCTIQQQKDGFKIFCDGEY